MMADKLPTQSNTDPVDMSGWLVSGYKNAQLNYILYLVSFFLGVTAIVALIFAYINRDEADEIVASHYQYQIRTFWIGLLYGVISALLAFVLIGFLLLILVGIWWLVRSIKGLLAVSKKEPVTDPKSWLF